MKGTPWGGKMHTEFWPEYLKERARMEILSVDWKVMLERLLKIWGWSGFVCRRIDSSSQFF